MTDFTPSRYQQAIFDLVSNPAGGNAFVEAVAGSGKTTTIVQAARLLPASVRGLFIAFNKSIAEELGARLRGTSMEAKTLHALGFAAVRSVYPRARVDANKGRGLAKRCVEAVRDGQFLYNMVRRDEREAWSDLYPVAAVAKLASIAKVTLSDTDDVSLSALADAFDVSLTYGAAVGAYSDEDEDAPQDFAPVIFECVRACIDRGVADAGLCIDYDDMIYLPSVDSRMVPQQYDIVFVDEAQDLNKAQQNLVAAALRPSGRIIAVGDRAQAIYGFAGADTGAVGRLIERFHMQTLPLSICYRCDTSMIRVAQGFVPAIEARDGAPAGIVRSIEANEFATDVRVGDMVLCRLTRHLISNAFTLIKAGVPANVKGRDLGAGLVAVVEKLTKQVGFGWDATAFKAALDCWLAAECAKVLRENGENGDDPRLESLSDRAVCVTVIYSEKGCESVVDFRAACDGLFTDAPGACVLFSSVHRAKGLESDRVFLLAPDCMPSQRARTAEAQQQERNLQYVAVTRAKHEFVFVGEPWKGVAVSVAPAVVAVVEPVITAAVIVLPEPAVQTEEPTEPTVQVEAVQEPTVEQAAEPVVAVGPVSCAAHAVKHGHYLTKHGRRVECFGTEQGRVRLLNLNTGNIVLVSPDYPLTIAPLSA